MLAAQGHNDMEDIFSELSLVVQGVESVTSPLEPHAPLPADFSMDLDLPAAAAAPAPRVHHRRGRSDPEALRRFAAQPMQEVLLQPAPPAAAEAPAVLFSSPFSPGPAPAGGPEGEKAQTPNTAMLSDFVAELDFLGDFDALGGVDLFPPPAPMAPQQQQQRPDNRRYKCKHCGMLKRQHDCAKAPPAVTNMSTQADLGITRCGGSAPFALKTLTVRPWTGF